MENLVYAWRKYDFHFLSVHCLFNLYVDGEYELLAVNVSVTQGTSEISSQRHLCVSDHMVTLRIP